MTETPQEACFLEAWLIVNDNNPPVNSLSRHWFNRALADSLLSYRGQLARDLEGRNFFPRMQILARRQRGLLDTKSPCSDHCECECE